MTSPERLLGKRSCLSQTPGKKSPWVCLHIGFILYLISKNTSIKEAKGPRLNFIQQTSAEAVYVRIHPSLVLDHRLKGGWLGRGGFENGCLRGAYNEFEKHHMQLTCQVTISLNMWPQVYTRACRGRVICWEMRVTPVKATCAFSG